jgi:hypothetical protein
MPVNFESDDIRPTFREYAMMLEEAAPELFTGEFQVVTEFGRSLCAKVCWPGRDSIHGHPRPHPDHI